MFTNPMGMGEFKVMVQTTENRGFTPDEIAKLCTDKLIHVSDQAPPAIKQQAEAYKLNIERLITHYMKMAVQSDRTTVGKHLEDAGHPKLAEAIRNL